MLFRLMLPGSSSNVGVIDSVGAVIASSRSLFPRNNLTVAPANGTRSSIVKTVPQIGLCPSSAGAPSVLEQLLPQLAADERRVLEAFAGGSILGVDALVAASGLGPSQVSATLLMLELKKLVAKRADGTYEARG